MSVSKLVSQLVVAIIFNVFIVLTFPFVAPGIPWFAGHTSHLEIAASIFTWGFWIAAGCLIFPPLVERRCADHLLKPFRNEANRAKLRLPMRPYG